MSSSCCRCWEPVVGCDPYSRERRPAAPRRAGVYLFTEDGVQRYVGRTRNFIRRFVEDVAPGSTETKPAFGFNIAKRTAAKGSVVTARDAGGDRLGRQVRQLVHGREGADPEHGLPLRRHRRPGALDDLRGVCVDRPPHRRGFNLFETH